MGPVVGIDLGTTNTVVAVVDDGEASAIADETGAKLIPSVVSFHPNGNVIVGRPAKERRVIDARSTVYSVKRLIGRSWDSEEVRRARSRFPFEMREGPGQAALIVARGETYTLPEISAFVLRKAKTVAEQALGTSIERAVITVPANFNDLQRAATKVAGRVAGLEVLRILNEPTAAALAYGYGKSANERIAVYDFGGGTFDVTLLDLSDNVFEVLATAGNTFLGGDDIDLIIAERMADQLLSEQRFDARADPNSFERLRTAAETLKMQLSTKPEGVIDVPELGHGSKGKALNLHFKMSRGELEQLAAPIIGQTFDVCREALGIARLSASDFDQVLLVGGSTRIPLVGSRVAEFFKRQPLANVSPDEVVAIGAAIQANALTGGARRSSIPDPPRPAARISRRTDPAISREDEHKSRPPPLPKSSSRRGTLPPGAKKPTWPPEPNTAPMRERMATAPGLNPNSGAHLMGPQRPMVVQPPGSSPRSPDTAPQPPRVRRDTGRGLGPGPDQPPATVAGLGPRGRMRTGPGLGPEAEKARNLANTLTSASEAALHARASQPDSNKADIPLPLVGMDDAHVEDRTQREGPRVDELSAEQIAQKYGNLPLIMPNAGAGKTAPVAPERPRQNTARIEESVPAFELSDADLLSEVVPNTGVLRAAAGPQSTDEVTMVRRGVLPSSPAIEEAEDELPIPEAPGSELDLTRPRAPAPFAPHVPPAPWERDPAGAADPKLTLPQGSPQVQRPLGGTMHMGGAAAPEQRGFGGTMHMGAPLAAGAATAAAGLGSTLQMPGAATPPLAGLPPLQPDLSARAPLLVDVTPLSLTVETVGGFCDTIIARNTPVPCEQTRAFVTAADNQTSVRVRVSQGESNRFTENTLLGEVELSGLRPGPRGQVQIAVTFALDTDGILNVAARDVATGNAATARVKLVGGADQADVARMAARHAAHPAM